MAITLDAIEYPPGSGTYQSIGDGTDYGGRFTAERPYGGLVGNPVEVGRAGASPSFQSISIGNRQIPMSFTTLTTTSRQADIYKWFNPSARDSSGDTTRYLRCTWHDGTTTLRIPVNVVSVTPRSRFADIVDVVVQAAWPFFEEPTAETQVTFTAGSATATNSGNADAGPLITITDGATSADNAFRFTITDTGGEGVTDVPVVLDAGSTILTTAADVYVFDQNGQSKRFVISGSRYIWTTCSLGPNETIYFYVIDYSGFDNPKAGTLDLGTFYTSATLNTSNQADGFLLSGNPARNGVWQPAQLGFTGGGGSQWGYEMTDGSTSCVFTLRDDSAKGKNDANGMVLVTGIPADSITGLSRVTATHTSGVRSFVRYRQANAANWVDAWTQTGNATVTTSITLVDAVEVAVGIEATSDTPTDSATLTLSGTGTPDITVAFDTSTDLTVSRADIDAFTWILDGNITNSTTGQVITFTGLIYVGSGGTYQLLLDFRHDATERISVLNATAATAILGEEGALTFSDPIGGLSIAPGSNSLTTTGVSSSIAIDFRSTYS